MTAGDAIYRIVCVEKDNYVIKTKVCVSCSMSSNVLALSRARDITMTTLAKAISI